jgi:hypothetical protein
MSQNQTGSSRPSHSSSVSPVSSNFKVIREFLDQAINRECLPKVKLFGVSLDSYMSHQKSKITFLEVPWIILKCCFFLLEEGIGVIPLL